jgi:DNA-binding transcriptional ArsR family regulator
VALSGTLKDFGIADILQLIGHQTKTGRLTLKSGGEEVEVFFIDGNVVFASDKSRNSKNLLGSLLLRAELLSAEQLEEALGVQQRTLKRLGDILVDNGAVTQQQLGQMMRLQTTETLYKLFAWKNGSYEFSQEDVDPSRSTFDAVRAESILLEGFRRMDEWPALKKKVPWQDATFDRLRELDTRDLPSIDDGGLGLDGEEGEGKPTEKHKLVYRLAVGGKDVQRVVDASRIGEFEALKSINDLCEWGFLRLVPPPSGAAALTQGIKSSGRKLARSGALLRLALSLAFFVATLFLVKELAPQLGAARAENPARRGAVARLISHDQLVRLESALELYKTEHGEYPLNLKALTESQLVTERDLSYPYRETYYYRRTQQGFVLLPPLD